MPYAQNAWYVGPDYWPKQCKLSYYEYYDPVTQKYGGHGPAPQPLTPATP